MQQVAKKKKIANNSPLEKDSDGSDRGNEISRR
jgi:hypothetical protein